MAAARGSELEAGDCVKHAVQHDDGTEAGTVVGVIWRMLGDRPEGRGYEVEYFGTGDPYFSWWFNQKVERTERFVMHVCTGPVSRCRYRAPSARMNVLHTRTPVRTTAAEATDLHMELLQMDSDQPALPPDVAAAALEEEPPRGRAGIGGRRGLPRRRQEGACRHACWRGRGGSGSP